MTSFLYGIDYSPWTERARWALDHHRVPYRFRAHVPMVGEPLLRLRVGSNGGKRVTVPFFVTENEKLADSLDIILHADRVGTRPKLVRDLEETRRWRDRIEVGLSSVRARVTAAVLADPEALRESAMAVSPAFLAGAMRPMAAMGARFIVRKYGAALDDPKKHDDAMRSVAEEIRAALKTRDVIGGEQLSAVDLLAATFLQGLRAPDAPHLHLGPAVAKAWGHEQLAREYADLVGWRDRLYASRFERARDRD